MLWPAYDLPHTPTSGRRNVPTVPLRIPANRLTIITGGQAAERRQLLATLSGHGDDLCGQLFGQPACPSKLQRLACCQQSDDRHCRQPVRHYVLRGRLPHHSWWLRGNEHDLHIVDQLLREFELSQLAEQRFCQLTATERQLAAIARCLASTAPIVLLEEPAAGLAPQARQLLLQRLQRLAITGRTIVLALQDQTLARQQADWLIDLNDQALRHTDSAPDTDTTAAGGCLERARRSA